MSDTLTPNEPTLASKCLFVMAHGSRAHRANEEFAGVVQQMTPFLNQYQEIEPIFLELCEPGLHEAVNTFYGKGYRNFDLYPMFFNEGKHVGKDIPAQIQACLAEHDDITITQLDYFGSFSSFAKIMAQHIANQSQL